MKRAQPFPCCVEVMINKIRFERLLLAGLVTLVYEGVTEPLPA